MGITAAKPFLLLEVEVGAAAQIGDMGAGARRFIPITGGRVSGEIQAEPIGRLSTMTARSSWKLTMPFGPPAVR